MAEIKKWRVFYDTDSDFGEVDLEERLKIFQNHTSAVDKVKEKKCSSFQITLSAKENYTKIESSGNNLLFDSEGKDGTLANMQVYCWFGADQLPRYNVKIDGAHYRVVPKKVKKEF